MCGIAGIINNQKIDLNQNLGFMVKALHHRGPDRQDKWIDQRSLVGLAHTRLAILDLSETGNQPMQSHSGNFTIVFNGEIYNHQALRAELDRSYQTTWRGTSDTEAILEAFEHWGLKDTLRRCIGMFAFALYDHRKEVLYLGRDRMGEKPLYYGWIGDNFVFASEVAAIEALPEFKRVISRNALGLYLQYSSVPEPYSIYEGVFKLKSGNLLTLDIRSGKHSTESWVDQLEEVDAFDTEKEVVDRLNDLLISSVRLQMQADVPTGAFLSGGIDSSTVAAVMQSLSSKKIETFTIGFEEKAFNEANFARDVANHIGSNHHELYVGEKDLLAVVPQLSQIYSEPFSEASQIPTFLVSKVARQKVTVSLSGDGGDELFCGYWRYHFANSLWNKIRLMPAVPRRTISNLLGSIPYSVWAFLLSPLRFRKGDYGKALNYPDRLLKLLEWIKAKSPEELYQRFIMIHNSRVHKFIPDFEEPETFFSNFRMNGQNYYDYMMTCDQHTYLPNNNLTKVDRAAMAVSLETRVPLLDPRIVSFARSLPLDYKIRNGNDKWVLRQVLYRYVPERLFNRPKKGFSVPLAAWLRGPLKDWSFDLLNEDRTKDLGFFEPTIVQNYWKEHQSGKRNWAAQLWDIALFHDWFLKRGNQ